MRKHYRIKTRQELGCMRPDTWNRKGYMDYLYGKYVGYLDLNDVKYVEVDGWMVSKDQLIPMEAIEMKSTLKEKISYMSDKGLPITHTNTIDKLIDAYVMEYGQQPNKFTDLIYVTDDDIIQWWVSELDSWYNILKAMKQKGL